MDGDTVYCVWGNSDQALGAFYDANDYGWVHLIIDKILVIKYACKLKELLNSAHFLLIVKIVLSHMMGQKTARARETNQLDFKFMILIPATSIRVLLMRMTLSKATQGPRCRSIFWQTYSRRRLEEKDVALKG